MKKQVISFIFIGVLNTIVGYLLYAFFIFINFHYSLAAFFATVLGILFNFQTFKRFVFKTKDASLIKFYSVYIITYLQGITIIWLCKKMGFNDYIGGFVSIFPNAVLSFLLNKLYVFRSK